MHAIRCGRDNDRPPLILDGLPLATHEVLFVARHGRAVALGDRAMRLMRAAREGLEARLGDAHPHYGVNTGFGSLARRRVGPDELRQLQRNLVRSHACGVGARMREEWVRGAMLLLAASLARGRSGVRPVVAERLVDLLNAGVTPAVPELGSVGASGDLAPLAHIALTLIGEGEALGATGARPSGDALREAGLAPVTLEAKEGLALINGTHLMGAEAALLCEDFDTLLSAAVDAAAMSLDAYRGTDGPLDPRAHEARGQPGGREVAGMLRARLAGSEIVQSHKFDDPRVQDPYSLRCAAYVLGAALDASRYVKQATRRELAAVTDNPLVFTEPGDAQHAEIVSAGNFHGMPIALPLDTLAMALAHIAGIAERRTYLLLAAPDPESHLSPYLTPKPGVQSGLMIAQYTAAACCNEMIQLASPASVVNIPTCAGIEDYNSFGPRSAAKARRAVELAQHVVAIELLCGAQGLEHHRPLRSGAGVERAYERVRSISPTVTDDRSLSGDIEAVSRAVGDGVFSGTG